jgi:signal transduction histidine kinase
MFARDFDRMADRLEALIASQQRLLRDVSHELRSPLARLQVSLALAQDAADDAGRTKNLARIAKEAERLDALVSEILDYARLAAGMQVRADPVDLVEVLDHVAESARVEGEPRGLRVVRKSPARAVVAGDVEMLLRAVDNVVRNAVRHSPDGGTIELRIRRSVVDRHWRIEVEDQGPGVPDALLERIFEPFVRVSAARIEVGAGGGVGLAIARETVARHEGRITARNRDHGSGLLVTIDLPARDVS